jgi:hypothetical protein
LLPPKDEDSFGCSIESNTKRNRQVSKKEKIYASQVAQTKPKKKKNLQQIKNEK